MRKEIKQFWCPFFSGFYGTIWDTDYLDDGYLEDYLGHELPENYTDNLDYESYRNDVVCKIIKLSEELYNKYLRGGIHLIRPNRYEPREYNFRNSRAECTMVIDDYGEFLDCIKDYLKDEKNLKWIMKKCREEFTSRSGFVSFYPGDFTKWNDDLNSLDMIQIRSLIQWIVTDLDGRASGNPYDEHTEYEIEVFWRNVLNEEEISIENYYKEPKVA